MRATNYTDNLNFKHGNSCVIHEDVRFAHDEECPVCDEDMNDEETSVYLDHINHLDKRIKKLEKEITIISDSLGREIVKANNYASDNKKLLECVEFYAGPDGGMTGGSIVKNSERARQVLKEIKYN